MEKIFKIWNFMKHEYYLMKTSNSMVNCQKTTYCSFLHSVDTFSIQLYIESPREQWPPELRMHTSGSEQADPQSTEIKY